MDAPECPNHVGVTTNLQRMSFIHGSSFQPHPAYLHLMEASHSLGLLASWAGALYPEGRREGGPPAQDMHRGRSPPPGCLQLPRWPARLVASPNKPGPQLFPTQGRAVCLSCPRCFPHSCDLGPKSPSVRGGAWEKVIPAH